MRSALLSILASLAFVAACGDNSVHGPAGANGADGMDGSTTLVSTSTEPAGPNCAVGGVRIDVGIDDNGDGVLDAGEIDHTSYVCSGDATAHDSLVSVTAEPAGANCADGGQRIDYGVDDDDSGVLDVGEIDGTSYVCDSAAGSDGRPNLLAVSSEPAGANCTSGGQRIDYGIDDDGNGVLDAAEVDGTTYVCNGGNGQDGLRSLIAVTAEPAGANCATGGQRVENGIDDDGNGTLDAAEVDGTTYVCNGADGTSPPQSLLNVTAEPAGANCATGGQRIDHGIDDDGNGTLDAAEIDGTTFICNGADGSTGQTGAQSLVAVTPETAGLNCATGGQRIDYGIDDDADGTLDAGEIDGTTYVCNGADGTAGQNGLQSLLAVTPEPAGTNCADGGQRIDYGIDDNGNGTLEAGEIDGTAYACDGATGGNGLQTLVTTTPEAAGTNCAAGGQRIDYGLDDNSDGTLDAGEIDGTAYTCNGVSWSPIANGSFETGDYTGWTLSAAVPNDPGTSGIGTDGQTLAVGDTMLDYLNNVPVTEFSISLPITFAATNGSKVAVELQNGPVHRRMYQDVTIPNGTSVLDWDMRYSNDAGNFDANFQYLAINVRDPITDAILATIYKTTDGPDAQTLSTMTAFSASIAPYAGQRVRIDVEVMVQFSFFDIVLDNFRVE